MWYVLTLICPIVACFIPNNHYSHILHNGYRLINSLFFVTAILPIAQIGQTIRRRFSKLQWPMVHATFYIVKNKLTRRKLLFELLWRLLLLSTVSSVQWTWGLNRSLYVGVGLTSVCGDEAVSVSIHYILFINQHTCLNFRSYYGHGKLSRKKWKRGSNEIGMPNSAFSLSQEFGLVKYVFEIEFESLL